MGALTDHDLLAYRKAFRVTSYLETGCGMGENIRYASNHFTYVHGCEIDEVTHASATKSGKYWHADVALSASDAFLASVAFYPGRYFFFLDAHFPGMAHYAHLGLARFDENVSPELIVPVRKELEILIGRRDLSRDVVIIDDLSMFGNEVMGYTVEESDSFCEEFFAATHDIKRCTTTDSIIITPRA